MYPPEPSRLDVQAMTALKPEPIPKPTVNQVHARLINGRNNLFFVVFEGEWRLVSVAYKDTMSLHPDCLQDGKFLVDFYILHPKDHWFGAPNQRFWLEYHRPGSSTFARRKSSYHLVQPTKESHLYATSRGLVPYRQWMYILHDTVFINGAFEFTMTAHGRQSMDRVSVEDWRILHNHRDSYSNEAPSMKLVSQLSLHCTPLFHTEVDCPIVDARLLSAPLLSQNHYHPV